MEQTLKSMESYAERSEEAATGARSDLRKAVFAAVGSLFVMVVVFIVSHLWQSMQARNTEMVVQAVMKQMATTAKQP